MDTEHLLMVTFYDNNGDLALGTFEANYRTGFSDAESFEITADQFDTSRLDDDGDGLSNIAELIAGTDPLLSNVDLPDIMFSDTVGTNFTFFEETVDVAAYYEAELLALALPIEIHEETIADNRPQHFQSDTRDIVISVDGNGTYSKIHYEEPGQDQPSRRSSVGTRSQQADTVSWSGTQLHDRSTVTYNGYLEMVFETSNTKIGRELFQNTSGTRTGKEDRIEDIDNVVEHSYEVVLDLDSIDSENTCAVLYGVFSYSLETNLATDSPVLIEQILSRDSTDASWAWTRTSNRDGEENSRGEALELNQRFYCNFLVNYQIASSRLGFSGFTQRCSSDDDSMPPPLRHSMLKRARILCTMAQELNLTSH